MIEISNLPLGLAGLDGTPERKREALLAAVAHTLRISEDDIASLELRKRSIDARKRQDVHLVLTARATLGGGEAAERKVAGRARTRGGVQLRLVEETPSRPLIERGRALPMRPVVVGAGCAGLFCALALAEAGLEPLLIERGDDAARRSAVVRAFAEGGPLDPQSNIQFGLGGAGTFSDGKLYTGTRAPSHRAILELMVSAGAPASILSDAHPHIGSDLLPQVVDALAARIVELGGELRCRTRLTGIDTTGGQVRGVIVEDADGREERIVTSHVVLACGHSARDVFELMRDAGVVLERKTFAMGYRIEHLQSEVNRAQHGRFAGHPALGAAPYKLSCHLGERSAFSFCMCPGGYVVAAASEPGGVVTNGMSESGRDGVNANAGLLSNVEPADLPGDDPLAGIALQRACEQAAFEAGGGSFVAPAQLVGDFLQGVRSSTPGAVSPTYPRGVAWGSLAGLLPEHVEGTIRAASPHLGRRLAGFDASDAVLTGVDTRSSAPVRLTRGEDMQSVSCRGLYPCGEGAGYAGGIMSAAADGIRVARAIAATRA